MNQSSLYATLKTSNNGEIPEEAADEDTCSEWSNERYLKSSQDSVYHSVYDKTFAVTNLPEANRSMLNPIFGMLFAKGSKQVEGSEGNQLLLNETADGHLS